MPTFGHHIFRQGWIPSVKVLYYAQVKDKEEEREGGGGGLRGLSLAVIPEASIALSDIPVIMSLFWKIEMSSPPCT